ncbi:MAG: hypothetical protein C0467_29015 [Planctomycetaceae bacterium]|nr:hypothetical protein [Planctomycetaceae bacterium]
MTPSLCETCGSMREIVTPRGSRFLMCRLAATDPTFAKYPPQPVVHCSGYVPKEEGDSKVPQGGNSGSAPDDQR